jgi:hypothetical protein
LGAKQGPQLSYNWVPASLLPKVLPWLVLLGLLALRRNRTAQAWWIWAPVACGLALPAGISALLNALSDSLPGQIPDLFSEVAQALNFGLAATWLLAGGLGWKHRFLTFLGILFTLAGAGALTFVCAVVGDNAGFEVLGAVITLGLCALSIGGGLTLAGLLCRTRFGAVRLTLWLVASLVAVSLAVLSPFFVIALLSNPREVEVWGYLLLSLLALAGAQFICLLPYLVLSFANTFYRERLKALLHLGLSATPPLIAPAPPSATLTETHAPV